MQYERNFTLSLAFLLSCAASACSTGDSDPRSGDGGIDFVDGATPPCDGAGEGVCVIEDGGVIIQTPDGGTTQCF